MLPRHIPRRMKLRRPGREPGFRVVTLGAALGSFYPICHRIKDKNARVAPSRTVSALKNAKNWPLIFMAQNAAFPSRKKQPSGA